MTPPPHASPLAPDLFADAQDRLWVMHCAEGPVPRAAAQAIVDFLPRETDPWRLRWEEDFQQLPTATREAAARIIGAKADDITLTPTTSSGLVTVAQGFPWVAGDEVLIPAGEFPSNIWPWKALAARGVQLREVALWDGHVAGRRAWDAPPPDPACDPEARLLAAIGPRTRIVAVSWVRFQDGLRLDVARLADQCAARGVLLVIDGIQGAGTLPLALRGLAGAFATGGHKGLLAPQGLGFLWTDPGLRGRLIPTGSWLSVDQATDFERPSTDTDRAWCTDGTRLEAGVPNLVACAALQASMAMIATAGVDEIARHIAALQGALLDALMDTGWHDDATRLRALLDRHRLGSILALHHGDRGPAGLAATLQAGLDQNIYASVREGYLRIALHGWHSQDDVARLAAWLSEA